MYLWMTLVVLLTVKQVNCNPGGCPLDNMKCHEASFVYRKGDPSGLTYKHCLDKMRKAVKTRATCYKEGVETVIAQKACSCDPRTITDSLTLTLLMPYLNMIFCDDIITDIRLPTCDATVRECVLKIKNYAFQREMYPDGYIILDKCSPKQKTLADEAIKCINETKNKDLSGCGSVNMLKAYAPLAALFNFICSGCDIYRMAVDCNLPLYGLKVCHFFLDESKRREFVGCMKQKLASDVKCSPLIADATSFLKELKRSRLYKLGMNYCKVQSQVEKEYDSWGCPNGEGPY